MTMVTCSDAAAPGSLRGVETTSEPKSASHRRRFANGWTHAATTVTAAAALVRTSNAPWPTEWFDYAVCGLYILLGTAGIAQVERTDSRALLRGYFAVMSLLLLALLGMSSGHAWLAALPLLSHAVLFLSLRVAAFGGLAVLGTVIATIPRQFLVDLPALLAGLGAAILFVIIFTVIAKREVEWRERSDALREQLEVANVRLRAYAVEAAEIGTIRERNRMAREVHDGLGHYLTAIHVQLEAARVLLPEDVGRARILRAQQLARQGLEDVRQAVALLRAPPARGGHLSLALRDLAHHNVGPPEITFDISGEPTPLPSAVEHTLLRVAQEALTNVRRHAEAAAVKIRLDYAADHTSLDIRDDGRGDTGSTSGFGLIGIRERVALLGGRVTIGSPPSGGFSVNVEIPR